jgi:integrase
MSPQTLEEIFGHSSYNMTMDLYYHNTSDVQKKEMEKLSRKLNRM